MAGRGWSAEDWRAGVEFIGAGALFILRMLSPPPEGEDQHDAEDDDQVHVSHEVENLFVRLSLSGPFRNEQADFLQRRYFVRAVGRLLQSFGQVASGIVPPHMHALFPQRAQGCIVNLPFKGKIGGVSLLAVACGQLFRSQVARQREGRYTLFCLEARPDDGDDDGGGRDHDQVEADLDDQEDAETGMDERVERSDPVVGEDCAGQAHDGHGDDADPHLAARQAAGRIGGLEHQMDVEDGAEPEYRGEKVDVTCHQAEYSGDHAGRGGGGRRFVQRSGKGRAVCGQFAAAGRIQVAGSTALAGLRGVFLGGPGLVRRAEHEQQYKKQSGHKRCRGSQRMPLSRREVSAPLYPSRRGFGNAQKNGPVFYGENGAGLHSQWEAAATFSPSWQPVWRQFWGSAGPLSSAPPAWPRPSGSGWLRRLPRTPAGYGSCPPPSPCRR